MRKVLLIALLAIAPEMINAQTFKESIRYWDEYVPLNETDFQAKPSEIDTAGYYMPWKMQSKIQQEKIDGVSYTYLKCYPSIDKSRSWIKEGENKKAYLRMCNYVFNACELYCRRATKEVQQLEGSDISYDQVFDYYYSLFVERFREVRLSTHDGIDDEKMTRYEKKLAEELAEENRFRPELVTANEMVFSGAIQMSLGSAKAFSDYASATPLGLGVSLQFGYKRHIFGLDGDVNFLGEFEKTIEVGKYDIIEKGKDLNFGQFSVTYGYNLKGAKHPVIPFVGVGMASFSAPQVTKDGTKNEVLAVSGVTFVAGVNYCLPIKRTITYMPDMGGSNKNYGYHSIVIKPAVGLSYFKHGPGWVPSLRVSIGYDMRVNTYK